MTASVSIGASAGIDLRIGRRRRQIVRQQVLGGVDRRLRLLFGDVERDIERELKRDDRRAGRARRTHLIETGHLTELPLERRRDPLAMTSGLAPG